MFSLVKVCLYEVLFGVSVGKIMLINGASLNVVIKVSLRCNTNIHPVKLI